MFSLKMFTCVVLVTAAVCIVPAVLGQTPGRSASITLTLNSEATKVKTGLPVIVDVTLTNVSKQPIPIETERRLGPEHNFEITVWNRGNQTDEAHLTRHGRAVKGKIAPGDAPDVDDSRGSTFQFLLAPGETTTSHIDVTRLYDLSGPGIYTIQARRRDPVHKSPVRSNTIEITITP